MSVPLALCDGGFVVAVTGGRTGTMAATGIGPVSVWWTTDTVTVLWTGSTAGSLYTAARSHRTWRGIPRRG